MFAILGRNKTWICLSKFHVVIQLYNRFENGLSIQRMTAFGSKYAMEETFDEMEGYWIDQN